MKCIFLGVASRNDPFEEHDAPGIGLPTQSLLRILTFVSIHNDQCNKEPPVAELLYSTDGTDSTEIGQKIV
jgi:hypothetical protein